MMPICQLSIFLKSKCDSKWKSGKVEDVQNDEDKRPCHLLAITSVIVLLVSKRNRQSCKLKIN
jgi:hypothetical protein